MKNYILYGAASIGNIAKESLEQCGLQVVGYIDKRAFELSVYNELPVWGIDSVPDQYMNEDTVVYVSVKNVFEHEAIAANLLAKGFRYIIYKPYSVLLGYGSREECALARLYDDLFVGDVSGAFSIPEIPHGVIIHDFAKINEENGMITAYIPVEFIFTNNYRNSEMVKWGNVNILAFFTHIDFFRFLSNQEGGETDSYLQEYCIFTANLQRKIKVTDAWKNNVIENRTQIYEQMKEALDLDPAFFIRNAAEAEWNCEKHYFNLTSGKHRCTFLAAMNKKYIPLKMKQTDYEQFFHAKEVDETMRFVRSVSDGIQIPHPAFYRGMFIRDRGEHQFLIWFARYFGRKLYQQYGSVSFSALKVTDFSNDYGHFARFCVRLGCRIQRAAVPDAVERQLNRLSYSDDLAYCTKGEPENPDIIVADGTIEGVLDADTITALIGAGCTIVVKYISDEMLRGLAKRYKLTIVSEINRKKQDGTVLKSYLLKGHAGNV